VSETKISYEEWAACLAEVNKPVADGMTCAEWSVKLGRHRNLTSAWIRDGLTNGWIERVTVVHEMITGTRRRSIGFRVLAPETRRTISSTER
jgi:hypothetical protein